MLYSGVVMSRETMSLLLVLQSLAPQEQCGAKAA
jgi:hypothetical protein